MKKVLENLALLQDVDTQLRSIEIAKGDLPREVTELKEQIETMKKNIQNLENQNEELKTRMAETEEILKAAQVNLKKYQAQLYDVKTNREYDAITIEIENATNEINDSETKLLEYEEQMENKGENLGDSKEEYKKLLSELEEKEKELTELIKKSEEEELKLQHEREKLVMTLKPAIIKKYDRIRLAKNGLAVARIERDACGGCKTIIPPQKVVEISKQVQLITCEICGRILVPENFKNNVS